MGAAFGPEAVKGFKAIHEFLDDKATIGVISHEFQQIARSVRDNAAEIAEIIGYAKSFNEWWLGTNKKPEEKSEVVPPMNRWWNNLGVKDAITQGFLEALRQNSAGTYTPMAFHPGGGSSRGGGYFGSKDYPAVGGNAGANPMSGGGIVPDDAGAGTNAVVTGAGTGINRDKWAAQLRANPALRDKLYRRALGENSNPMANQAVMEEAANRADIRGNKSFDDHGNLKYFQGYYGGRISAKQREMLDSNFAKVFDQGSDISKGAIDNSSQWLSLKHERTGRFRTTANFGGDGITGHRGVESFQVPGTGESGAGEKSHYPEFRRRQLAEAAHRQMLAARETHGAALRDHIRHGRQSTTDGSLLTNGRRSDAGLTGSASLTIDLNGFPRGTQTAFQTRWVIQGRDAQSRPADVDGERHGVIRACGRVPVLHHGPAFRPRAAVRCREAGSTFRM